MSLRDLAIKYSSDKYYWHSYIDKYEELFKGMQVKKLFEIGIGYEALMKPFLPADVPYIHGSSLKMWEEYFPEAEIYGCDIREDALINEGRIRSVVCDQSKVSNLIRMLHEFHYYEWKTGRFDVIIDDGSHLLEHQRFTAQSLIEATTQLYVIEDVWPEAGMALACEFGGEFWAGEKGRDDNLVIIRK